MEKYRNIIYGAEQRNPWTWIPSLYVAKGLPYMMLMMLSLVMFKRLGLGNAEITFYTSCLLLPWVLKPLWRPVVDLCMTRRMWIVVTELFISLSLIGVAHFVDSKSWLLGTMIFLFLLAFSAATHDIAIDSFYQLSIEEEQRLPFVRVRRFFYRLSMVLAQGVLVMVAGNLEVLTRQVKNSWAIVVYIVAGILFLLMLLHLLILPQPSERQARGESITYDKIKRIFRANVRTFRQKPHARAAIFFLLTYMVVEGLFSKVSILFLIDRASIGGLALSLQEFGYVQGTVGVISLVVGGIVGSHYVRCYGLQRCLYPMAAAFTLPKVTFVFLSHVLPESLFVINLCVMIEQFGYGFGMTAYFLFLVHFCQGPRTAAHYGIGIALMSFTLMLTGMVSGLWVEAVGYRTFFIITLLFGILTFLAAAWVRNDSDFGKEEETDRSV